MCIVLTNQYVVSENRAEEPEIIIPQCGIEHHLPPQYQWWDQLSIYMYIYLIKVPETSSRAGPSNSKAPLSETFWGLLKNVKPFWHTSHVRVFQNRQMGKIRMKLNFPQKSSIIWYTSHVRVFQNSQMGKICTKLSFPPKIIQNLI